MRQTGNFIDEHPTGVIGAVFTALFALNEENGWILMSETTSVLVLGAIVAVASLFTPRWRRS